MSDTDENTTTGQISMRCDRCGKDHASAVNGRCSCGNASWHGHGNAAAMPLPTSWPGSLQSQTYEAGFADGARDTLGRVLVSTRTMTRTTLVEWLEKEIASDVR